MSTKVINILSLLLEIEAEMAKTKWWQFKDRRILKDIKKPLEEKLDKEWKLWTEMS